MSRQLRSFLTDNFVYRFIDFPPPTRITIKHEASSRSCHLANRFQRYSSGRLCHLFHLTAQRIQWAQDRNLSSQTWELEIKRSQVPSEAAPTTYTYTGEEINYRIFDFLLYYNSNVQCTVQKRKSIFHWRPGTRNTRTHVSIDDSASVTSTRCTCSTHVSDVIRIFHFQQLRFYPTSKCLHRTVVTAFLSRSRRLLKMINNTRGHRQFIASVFKSVTHPLLHDGQQHVRIHVKLQFLILI